MAQQHTATKRGREELSSGDEIPLPDPKRSRVTAADKEADTTTTNTTATTTELSVTPAEQESVPGNWFLSQKHRELTESESEVDIDMAQHRVQSHRTSHRTPRRASGGSVVTELARGDDIVTPGLHYISRFSFHFL